MQLHQLPTRKSKKAKRVGRGGKRGTTSGRGTKGQKSRSGHVIRPAERDLILRIPKHRGFRNKPVSSKPLVLNVSDLEKHLAAAGGGALVDREFLASAGLVGADSRQAIKVLGGGEIKTAVILRGIAASAEARAKIEKAGGKVEI